jgi:hypothetical protein
MTQRPGFTTTTSETTTQVSEDNTYAYVEGNPLSMIDPHGLLGIGDIVNAYNVFLCVRALPAVKRYAKQCEQECPTADDLKGQIQFIEKYATNGSLDQALIGCTCEKAGPRICGDAIAKCTSALGGKVRPRTQ